MTPAFFRVAGTASPAPRGPRDEVLVPQPIAASGWGGRRIRGMAVCGALARAVEHAVAASPAAGFPVARWTVDLFRPALAEPSVVDVESLRMGRRAAVFDATLRQRGIAVARASAVLLHAAEAVGGTTWTSSDEVSAPPAGMTAAYDDDPRLYFSESAGWTASADDHQNGDRKQLWAFAHPIVEGESPTPFQLVASAADAANIVLNWGDAGLEHINVDVTLALSRLPEGDGVGFAAVQRTAGAGVAVGTTVVFDRAGGLGSATVVALAHPAARVDVRTRRPAGEAA